MRSIQLNIFMKYSRFDVNQSAENEVKIPAPLDGEIQTADNKNMMSWKNYGKIKSSSE